MSTSLTPRTQINDSTAAAQRGSPNMVDHNDQLADDPFANLSIEERARYSQMLVAEAAARSVFVEQPVSKVLSYKASSPTEQLRNEAAQLTAKPGLRYPPFLPSTRINGMLPLIDFKEKPTNGTERVTSATAVPQNHRQPASAGQTDPNRERVEIPAALAGGVIGSRDYSAESSNQARTHDTHQRRASSQAPLPEPTTLSSDLPSYNDLARDMQAQRDAFRSSREKANGLFSEKFSQPRDNRSALPVTSGLGPDMQAHREAFRSTREKTSGLFYESLLQQNENLDVASKRSSHHTSELAAKELTRQTIPQTPVLRPTQEESRVASETLPNHQHQTKEADGKSQLGKMPPLLSSENNIQPPSNAALLDYQAQLCQLEYENQLRKLELQAALHGFGGLHQGLNRSRNSLSDDELEMIHPFMRKLATSKQSTGPPNPQELAVPRKLHMAQKGPQNLVDTKNKCELQNAMVHDLDKQDVQARRTKSSLPLLPFAGGLQDTYAAWSEPDVANTSPVDSHCSQKKAPVDGSYLAEEERKVLDHVRGSMSTNIPVTKVQDRSSTNTGGNPEPARRSVFKNSFMEGLQTLNDHPNLREHMTSRVGYVRPIGSPLDVDLPQGPVPEASTPSMAQAHKATQTYPGQKTDPYKELDAIMQRQSVKALSWNTTNMETSRRTEENVKLFHARLFREPSQTRSSTSTGIMSVPNAAFDNSASRIPVRESTAMPPVYEYHFPCRPKSEKADVSFSRPTPLAPNTYGHSVFSRMQSSGAQTPPSVSTGQYSKGISRHTRTLNSQTKPAKEIPNELHVVPNRGGQRGQVTGKSSELLGMLQDFGNGISSQATKGTPVTEDHAESTVKPIVSNKLQLSEEKREQMIKEGPRSLRDFQRAMGCTDSGAQAVSNSHSLARDTNLKPVEKEPAASKILCSAAEKGDQYDKRRLRELMCTLCLDVESKSQRGSESGNGNGRLESGEEYYLLDRSKPHAMNKPRAAKAEIYPPEKDAIIGKPSYYLESEGQVISDREYALEEFRHTECTNAKINLPTADSTSTATKTHSWVEPRTVGREKLIREFWSQPKNMTTYKGPDRPDYNSKSRSGSSPISTRNAMCNLPSPPLTPEADLRSDIGGPDIDNWRMLVDFESKAPSAAALATANGKPTFSKEPILPILGSAPAENEDPVATSLPVFTHDVASKTPAAGKATNSSATPQATFSSRNGISVSITGDAEARSASASTDVFFARNGDEDNGKGDQTDWTLLDSDYSFSRDPLGVSNEMLEAAPSEASDPSSMDVEVGDDGSEVNEDEWIIC